MLTKEKIKEIALASGFKLKEQAGGSLDLNQYVYVFANEISKLQDKSQDTDLTCENLDKQDSCSSKQDEVESANQYDLALDDAVNEHKENLTKVLQDFGEHKRINGLLRDIDSEMHNYEWYFKKAWQYRQAEINLLTEALDIKEKLNHKLREADARNTELALDQMNTAKLNYKLQQKIDAVKTLIDEYRNSETGDKVFKNALLVVASELEQALKGGEL